MMGSSKGQRLILRWLVVVAVMITAAMVGSVRGTDRVPAMFIFGDSLVDVGNNNFLDSIAKANYYPYGMDFNMGATGRFSNAKTSVDIIADLLGIAYPPPFADPDTVGGRTMQGVNYASAAGGILDETGQHYGARYSLSQQVLNFESTLTNSIRRIISGRNLTDYLSRSLAIMVFGSNDYLNNYLLPSMYSSSYTYTPPQFANLLLNRYARQLVALYSLGLRKFFIAGVGPIGCIPNQRASGHAPPGRCVDNVNQMLGSFNMGLRSMVDQLNTQPGAIYVYGNTYGAVGDILNNPGTYGFSVVDRACCGLGRNEGEITCLPYGFTCENRNQYAFWDAFHPTQAVNGILARRAMYGPQSDSYPINIQQITLLH